jgi:hypothetical protein
MTQLRRQFKLPEDDEDCLTARRLSWETIRGGDAMWLIVHDYPIPGGYSATVARLALHLPPTYPDDQIDMVYFNPSLALASGRGIRQLSMTTIDGQPYQQWSRHRTPVNPWRPGVDNIGTHLIQVDTWLRRELT